MQAFSLPQRHNRAWTHRREARGPISRLRRAAGLRFPPTQQPRRPVPHLRRGRLRGRLAQLGADVMPRALAALERGGLQFVEQSEVGVEYANGGRLTEARVRREVIVSGGAIGSIFGAFVLRTIGNLLLVFDLEPLWQPLFLGVVLLVAVSAGAGAGGGEHAEPRRAGQHRQRIGGHGEGVGHGAVDGTVDLRGGAGVIDADALARYLHEEWASWTPSPAARQPRDPVT